MSSSASIISDSGADDGKAGGEAVGRHGKAHDFVGWIDVRARRHSLRRWRRAEGS